MDRRGFVWAASVGVVGVALSREARGSLARAVAVTDLVGRSRHVMLGEPLDAYSVWEELGGRKHIVTYTRLRVHELFAGVDPQQDEVLVRTLGGRVGDLGELVHGEARLTLGERSVLFVMPARDVLAVTAMAQGHYPLLRDAAGVERLHRSPEAAELLKEDGSAVKRFTGMQVPEARALIRRTVRP